MAEVSGPLFLGAALALLKDIPFTVSGPDRFQRSKRDLCSAKRSGASSCSRAPLITSRVSRELAVLMVSPPTAKVPESDVLALAPYSGDEAAAATRSMLCAANPAATTATVLAQFR